MEPRPTAWRPFLAPNRISENYKKKRAVITRVHNLLLLNPTQMKLKLKELGSKTERRMARGKFNKTIDQEFKLYCLVIFKFLTIGHYV